MYVLTARERARAARDTVVEVFHTECGIASNDGRTRAHSCDGGPPPPGIAALGVDVLRRDKPLPERGLGRNGSLWSVIADLITNTTARVFVNGSFSEPWSSKRVRQSSVLGPRLFNLLFDSVADAVRGACPGVALGSGPYAPC